MKHAITFLAVMTMLLFSGSAFADEDNLTVSALKLEAGIKGLLKGIDGNLLKASSRISKLGAASPDVRMVLKELRLGRNYVIDCTFVDDKGIMKVIEPDIYRKYEGTDISDQQVVKEVQNTKKPVMSDVFVSVEGIKAVVFEAPVFSPKNEFVGFVSMLARIGEMVKCAAVQVEAGRGIKCSVIQKDGLIIYDTDNKQIGLNLFTNPLYKEYTELTELGKRMLKEPDGTGSYSFLAHGKKDVVRKDAAWRTISNYGKDWIIVTYQQIK
jgi:hypothetical protein